MRANDPWAGDPVAAGAREAGRLLLPPAQRSWPPRPRWGAAVANHGGQGAALMDNGSPCEDEQKRSVSSGVRLACLSAATRPLPQLYVARALGSAKNSLC